MIISARRTDLRQEFLEVELPVSFQDWDLAHRYRFLNHRSKVG